uniref:Uncharacterized protein n=2 Tax=Anguilla anguilla TaxID=7936 RepID=A0A0E9TM48_ANGAN
MALVMNAAKPFGNKSLSLSVTLPTLSLSSVSGDWHVRLYCTE